MATLKITQRYNADVPFAVAHEQFMKEVDRHAGGKDARVTNYDATLCRALGMTHLRTHSIELEVTE